MAISKSICGNLNNLGHCQPLRPQTSTGRAVLPLEEARHADTRPASGRRAKVGRTSILTRKGDMRVHDRGPSSDQEPEVIEK